MSPSREQTIADLTSRQLDLLVIGGGIVGAGVARDAAMRGLTVGLVEQYDFAFGASSRTSRLLHGGLRYLAQGRLGLVHEASTEKRTLHRIAPHLARPLPFVFPAYRRTDWPLWQLRIGVKLYDLLCHGRNLGPSGAMTAGHLLAHFPGLNPYGLLGAVRYFDGLTQDARLVLDTLRSAQRHGALLANYLRFENAEPHEAGWQCRLSDTLPGKGDWSNLPERPEGCLTQIGPVPFSPMTVQARTVVNATGPWSPTVPQSGVRLRLTKGIHLVVDAARLPGCEKRGTGSEVPVPLCSQLPEALVMSEHQRILFVIPWGDRVILGTTDTDYAGPLDDVTADAADVRYVLDVTNRAFPEARLTPDDVISTWAGLRPLIASKNGKPSDISRAHQIVQPHPGWLDVAGGKLTTYRLIAEQTIDRVFKNLAFRKEPCRTAEEPLLPPDAPLTQNGVFPPAQDRQIVEHCCRNEWAEHLDDVMIRRTSWHYATSRPMEIAPQIAAWMAETIGWDSARQEAELRRYADLCRRQNAWRDEFINSIL
jgi:glycerol-3-phosphate dehydrogenase